MPVAVVTGAGSGIGLSTCEVLLSLGYTVIGGIHDPGQVHETEQHLSKLGEASCLPLDVADDASIEAACQVIGSRYPVVDALINNAGISGACDPVDVSRDQLRRIFEVNTFGPAIMTRAMLPLLAASAHPRIVNVSSGGASFARASRYTVPMLAYSPSKTALNMITVRTHIRFQQDPNLSHIKINCCTPSTTATKVSGWVGQPPEDGARIVVHLATLPEDGPSGGYFEWGVGEVPW